MKVEAARPFYFFDINLAFFHLLVFIAP